MADYKNNMRDELKQIINNAEDALKDLTKFEEKGNHAAGVRVRSTMQLIKNGAHGVRSTVLDKIRADRDAAKEAKKAK